MVGSRIIVFVIAGLCLLGIGINQYALPAQNFIVIDGDTIERDGVRYRLLGFDTPETFHARCGIELAMGIAAKNRLRELLPSGKVTLVSTMKQDRYGRILARLYVDGKDVGQMLISEGLARPYDGRSMRKSWCE